MGQNVVIRKIPCPKCREQGYDQKGDNLVVYSDNSTYCFACGYSERGDRRYLGEEVQEQRENTKPKISFEQNELLKENTVSNVTFRAIRPETNKFFGVRYEVDDDGELFKQYVPCTIAGELSGYKPRELPKKFGTPIGAVGSECDMIGQFRFKTNRQTVLIVGGEVDQLSAYQMLRDSQIARGKGEYEAIAVVAPSVGESGCSKQVAKQYEFFNQFDKIVVGLDSDDAGRKAVEKLVKVLPKGKVFIAEWTRKDPNSYIWDNTKQEEVHHEREFVNEFYRAKKYVPAGILGSNVLYQKVIENAKIPKIPLPPFMRELEGMMAGGIPLGYIVNFGAASGVGKSSVVNEMIYHWIFNSPHLIGVVSMELDAGQYGEVMLSRHIGKKIALIADPEEKVEFLESEAVEKAATELFQHEDGSSRWHLLDDRDGSLDAVKGVVEELIVSCGCRVIVLDPLQDLLDGLSNEDQAVFMRWQKSMVKSHQITFININHMRKSGVGEKANSAGAFITEEDFAGSSTIFKSAGANVLMTRNKYAEDPIEKNTTSVIMSKCRWTGFTGNAGQYFYDNETHTLYDKESFFQSRPPMF